MDEKILSQIQTSEVSVKSCKIKCMIYIIREHITEQQLQEMMEMLGTYVKLAVDVERRDFGRWWSDAC